MMEDPYLARVMKRRSTVLLVLLAVGWALASVTAAPRFSHAAAASVRKARNASDESASTVAMSEK
jgi:hypothetical protein